MQEKAGFSRKNQKFAWQRRIALRIMYDVIVAIYAAGGVQYAENLSTEEASQTKSPWLQKENEHSRRPQGSEEKTRKRQSSFELLILSL